MNAWQVDDATLDELVSTSRDDDPFSLFSQGPDDAMSQMRDAISGRHAHIREHLRDRLGSRRTFLDGVSARLMADAGIDPLCVCVIAGKVEMLSVVRPGDPEGDDPKVYVDRPEGSPDGFVRMGPGVTWRIDGGLTLDALPETAIVGLEGRTIPQIVSHPIIDAAAPRIAGVRHETHGGVNYVHVDVPPSCACLTPQELLEIEIARTEDA